MYAYNNVIFPYYMMVTMSAYEKHLAYIAIIHFYYNKLYTCIAIEFIVV